MKIKLVFAWHYLFLAFIALWGVLALWVIIGKALMKLEDYIEKRRKKPKLSIQNFPKDMREAIRAWKREQMKLYRNSFRTRPYYPRPTARKSYKEKKNKE